MLYVKPKKASKKVEVDKVEQPLIEDKNESKIYSKGLSLKTRLYLVLIFCSVVIMGLASFGTWSILQIQKFTDEWYFAGHDVVDVKSQSGYKNYSFTFTLSWPLTKEKKEDKVTYIPVAVGDKVVKAEALTQEEKERIVDASGYSKIVRGIWILETNKGQNTVDSAHHNDCSKVGMTNEFGYRALDNYCFGSFEESVATVTDWIETQLKGKTLSAALCFYAKGTADSTCDYAIKFSQLDKDGKLASK
jgi:hypothetical protein